MAVNVTSELCNNFVLVPKAAGKVQLFLDPARLNEVLTEYSSMV